ncbi:MAG: DUF2130 domain-containing protein [Sphingobacteriales bacterium]|nr:MAG: DUF2130 domain-containing protein [Sphingobacteriales bacterium]
MSAQIKCPNCGNQFEPNDTIREEVEKELRTKVNEWKKSKEDEFARKEKDMSEMLLAKELAFNKKLQDEKAALQQKMEEQLRKSITADYENQVKLLEQSNKENEEKLKLSRQKELEFLKKEQELLSREQEIEIQLQKMLLQERAQLTETIRKEETERNSLRETEYQFKLKEMEEKLEQQKKLADEMKRKAEQGSMQLQGEVQEVALEELLRIAFPFDKVTEVGKGVRGADCVLTIRNNFGQECGSIIFESKRTVAFSNDWIEKLKTDMRSQGADAAVLVTQALPKEMSGFGEKEGVWVCSFNEVKAVVAIMRDAIVKIYNASQSQQNKGDKMQLLYTYLTSNEFGEQWKAVREGFMSMKLSILKERDAMEKLWKAREKQLEKVLLNAAHIKGSIEGIAGQSAIDFTLTDDDRLLEES